MHLGQAFANVLLFLMRDSQALENRIVQYVPRSRTIFGKISFSSAPDHDELEAAERAPPGRGTTSGSDAAAGPGTAIETGSARTTR